MSQAGKRTRRHFTPKEKVAILKRHLVDQVPVSEALHDGLLGRNAHGPSVWCPNGMFTGE